MLCSPAPSERPGPLCQPQAHDAATRFSWQLGLAHPSGATQEAARKVNVLAPNPGAAGSEKAWLMSTHSAPLSWHHTFLSVCLNICTRSCGTDPTAMTYTLPAPESSLTAGSAWPRAAGTPAHPSAAGTDCAGWSCSHRRLGGIRPSLQIAFALGA